MAMHEVAAAYAEGEATVAAAKALEALGEVELRPLVEALAGAQARAHLEAMGEVKLPKAIKKLARKAAYKLKSQGVSGEVKKAASVDLKLQVSLDDVAMITAPGIAAQPWLVLSALPTSPGVEIDFSAGGVPNRVRTFDGLTPGRIRRFLKDAQDELQDAYPMMAGAELAVRVIDGIGERMQGADKSGSFEHLRAWRDAAVALGATGGGCDARAGLEGRDDVEATGAAALLDEPRVGIMTPPSAALEAMMSEVSGLVHAPEPMEREAFDAKCDGLAESAADAWLADDATRLATAGWLELSADVLFGTGHPAHAKGLLEAADALRAAEVLPHEIPLVRGAFVRTFDRDKAWEHLQDHLENPEAHAHHVHGHDHDHDHDHDHG